jgi:hypothetical protein
MKAIFVSIFVLLLVSSAQAAQYRLNGTFGFVNDTDHEEQYVYGLGSDLIFNRKNDDRLSLLVGQRQFRNDRNQSLSGNKEETFSFLTVSGGKRFDTLRLDGKLSLYDGRHWSPILYGGSVAFDPSSRWHVEASAERDLVDSLAAVDRKRYVDSYSSSVDFNITPACTIVGAYTHQFITDGNDRDIEWVKVYYSPTKIYWLRLEAYGKHLTSEFSGFGYFSPAKLWEYMAIAQASRPFAKDRFIWRLRGGIGQQFVNNQAGKAASLLELKIRGWLSDRWGLDATGGFTNQSSVITSGTGYSRYYGSLVLTYVFP